MSVSQGAISFVAGLIFAIGLGISGMTLPAKVVGFLDVVGDWDPSLAMVMVGAIGVHFLAYRLLPTLDKPLRAQSFEIPSRQDISLPLIGGAILFGAGWGLGGFCPGPAVVSTPNSLVLGGGSEALVFTAAMLLGFGLYSVVMNARSSQPFPSDQS